ncbi:hypothetical protein GCM10010121_081830 [Streptomyces brasiliensis]|uniref:Uncharacterized protein n=1 Tax=Streptomyces brasiliensis TaxID=1954 RepID=A0A917LBY5_9ACTN|nr:hypothetical protein GCM10010121_081830 [Streptomyces brasiliensis]
MTVCSQRSAVRLPAQDPVGAHSAPRERVFQRAGAPVDSDSGYGQIMDGVLESHLKGGARPDPCESHMTSPPRRHAVAGSSHDRTLPPGHLPVGDEERNTAA